MYFFCIFSASVGYLSVIFSVRPMNVMQWREEVEKKDAIKYMPLNSIE